jgi:hypothetical protein
MWPFKRKKQQKTKEKHRIVGIVLGWDMKPHIGFDDGTYLPTDAERILYPAYFTKGDWPHDPVTGEKLKIAPI